MKKIVYYFFVLHFFVTTNSYAQGTTKNECQKLPNATLKKVLEETSQRISCRLDTTVSLTCANLASAAGVGVLTASAAYLATQALLKKQISNTLVEINSLLAQKSGQVMQHIGAASTGDLGLATSTSADGKAKSAIAKLEQEISKKVAFLEAQMAKNPGLVQTAIKKMSDPSLFFKLVGKYTLAGATNPTQAKAYEITMQKILGPLENLFRSSTVDTQLLKTAGLTQARNLTLRSLGGRGLAFLGGATASVLSLGLYSADAGAGSGCPSTVHTSFTRDANCNITLELSDSVLNFLEKPIDSQLTELKKDTRACEFYLNFLAKIRVEDRSFETMGTTLKDLQCSSGEYPKTIRYQTGINSEKYSFSLNYNKDRATSFLDIGKNENYRFDDKTGVLSQVCNPEKGSCTLVDSNTDSSELTSNLNTLKVVKFSAAEAISCCESEGEIKTKCLAKYSGRSTSSGSGSGTK